MANETSTITDNPATTSGVAKTGDAQTHDVLTRLAQDYQDKHGPAPSEGEPIDSTQEPAPPADVTGQPDDGKPKPDDSGAMTRLEQKNARNDRLLMSLGIDPDSDVAEKLALGVISKEDILRPATERAQATSPIDKVTQFEDDLRNRIKTGKGATEEDLLAVIGLIKESDKRGVELQQQSQLEAVYGQCQDATFSILSGDNLHTGAPEDIQAIEKQIFWTSTDDILGRDANEMGRQGYDTRNYFTPRSYTHYGQKNLERIQKLRNYWIEQGRQAQMKDLKPPSGPNPVSSTSGAGPIPPPQGKINLGNLRQVARDYLNRATPQV